MTPSAVNNSIFQAPKKIGAVELRPFSLAQFMFLQFMHNPVVTEERECNEIDIARALVVMSRPISETWRLWYGQDNSGIFPVAIQTPDDPEIPSPSRAFEAAAWETADNIGMQDIKDLGEHLKQRVDAEFAMAVPMRAPVGQEGKHPKSQADAPGASAGN